MAAGKFVTSRHLEVRLRREVLADVALRVKRLSGQIGFKFSGRGELHLSIQIEKIRREGYEFQVTRPQVILKSDYCAPASIAVLAVSRIPSGKPTIA